MYNRHAPPRYREESTGANVTLGCMIGCVVCIAVPLILFAVLLIAITIASVR